MGGTYKQGWDEALYAATSIINEAPNAEEAKKQLTRARALVKQKLEPDQRSNGEALCGLENAKS